MKKLIALIFGGRSGEHEISIISARGVYHALDRDKYDIQLIGISKKGAWYLCNEEILGTGEMLPSIEDEDVIRLPEIAVIPDTTSRSFIDLNTKKKYGPFDAAIPLTHGPLGEDGSIQGLLRLAGIPCIGADILGSAIGMDKVVSKHLFMQAGLKVLPFLYFIKDEDIDLEKIEQVLDYPVFVKPACLGSSVGISMATDRYLLKASIKNAFSFDSKVIIEKGIRAREIECAVLGNSNPRASCLGEIIPKGHEFYSYEAKYIDPEGAMLIIPASLDNDIEKMGRQIAIKAYKAASITGMARVDMFLTKDGFFINELNTIPGFTPISMYPKLWEYSGLPFPKLLDRLIELAHEANLLDYPLHIKAKYQ